MEKGRIQFGCEGFDGMIYMIGGQVQQTNQPTATCHRYILKVNKFEEISMLNKKRYGVTLCEFNSYYLYAFGGHHVGSYSKTCFERIRFNEMRVSTYWEYIEFDVGILEPENYIACVPINQTEIMIFGGQK